MANPFLAQAMKNNSSYAGFNPGYDNSNNGVLTLDNVLMKTLIQFAIIVPIAVISYIVMPVATASATSIGAGIVCLVLSLIINFKKKTNVPLILTYAPFEGLFIGGLSKAYNYLAEGSVSIALAATTLTALIVILCVKAGILRTTGTMRRVFGYALLGYIAFGLFSVGAALIGHPILTFGSPITIAVAAFGVAMASFSFVASVEDVNNAVNNNVGNYNKEDWRLSFGLVISLVWLYIEILRLVANIMSVSRN